VVYEYHKEVVNKGNAEDFFEKGKFVGYILDDGTIYRAKNHNIESLASFFSMTLFNLIDNYKNKNIILDTESNDRIAQILLNYFRNASYEELVALDIFIKQYNLTLSDLLVGYFRCHAITRLNKEILTAANDFECFHNYLLKDFKVRKIDKILYKDGKFSFVNDETLKNDYYMDEMEELKSEVSEDDREKFFR
jgi:hypothetical protein